MSAIAGVYHSDGRPIHNEQIHGLMGGLQKYPADDVQVWQKENVFLGCHAQWITPESVGEQQPYYDYERQLVITADAIIDNRGELFDKLNIERSQRKTMPDSQLILHAYSKWGEESPKHLIGDFVFMIWDQKNQLLFGARDFSGARTLYYHQGNEQFAFCTTIEPLLSLSSVTKRLNEQWLAEYLTVAGMIDSADASITPYRDILQVPPSHSITATREGIKLKRYCVIRPEKRLKFKSNEEYVEAFQDVFQQAVNSRLRTHKHIGSHLSGGLDSGAVVSFAAKGMREKKQHIHTFSYIPPNDFIDFTPKQLLADERPFIRSTVQYVGGIKDHYLDFSGRSSYSEIDSLLEMIETPYKFFENSFWLKGVFEKAHEEDVGILLSGDRGNFTVSWGLAMNYYAALLKKAKWLRLVQELNQYSQKAGGARLGRIPYIARIGFPFIDQLLSNKKNQQRPKLINQDFAESTDVFNQLKKHGIDQTGWFPSKDIYEERKKHFEHVFLWNAGNSFAAKMSLRYAVWKRDPTNDLRVVRFCLAVPEEQYVQKGVDRALIRRATANLLPDEVRLNQRIRGVQGADWVHRMAPQWDCFINELEEVSKDQRTTQFINSNVIKEALLQVKEGALPKQATNYYYKMAMRSIIIHRYLKKLT
ncbi:asparagine synthase-related protein [Domibacillus sp. PGB-M46]|uniref:asparagine synthase-related protein n=1 Tax=Domibacillus sp. PGB-M46 TaxID=2910255 RepID=UPI001F573B9F|nr:asparagine synthase-related protein [Domibacillus sp. PGB-M46]MCI2255190.1 asparagine synthase-related protein [Domibacillus sp. PGB-M46]